jgi:hypothetical protein
VTENLPTLISVFLLGAAFGALVVFFRDPICAYYAIRDSVRHVAFFSGHRMREVSRLNNCVVTITKCDRCDRHHIGWQRTARSTYESYPDEVCRGVGLS